MRLGLGILIAESEDGTYQPIGVVESVEEAKDMASANMAARVRDLEKGGSPMSVYCFKVWANSANGYRVVEEIPA